MSTFEKLSLDHFLLKINVIKCCFNSKWDKCVLEILFYVFIIDRDCSFERSVRNCFKMAALFKNELLLGLAERIEKSLTTSFHNFYLSEITIFKLLVALIKTDKNLWECFFSVFYFFPLSNLQINIIFLWKS